MVVKSITLLRYPGGKQKLVKFILQNTSQSIEQCTTYAEPFLGGGSVGLAALSKYSHFKRVILADLDHTLCCLWNAVVKNPAGLCSLIEAFSPSVDSYFQFKEDLTLTPQYVEEDLETGFKKLAVHQMSYSGLGMMAGGPIGGKSQTSKYDVGCRWSKPNLVKKIKYIHSVLAKAPLLGGRVLCQSYDEILCLYDGPQTFFYLDPPYFDKGQELYTNSFSATDHYDLYKHLEKLQGLFALSYDNVEFVRNLYSTKFKTLFTDVNYTINSSRTKTELLIVKDKLYAR